MGCGRIVICAVGATLALFLGFCRWCYMVGEYGSHVDPGTAAGYCFLWAAVAVLWLVLGVGGRLRRLPVLLGAATVTLLVLAFLHWCVLGIQVLNAMVDFHVPSVTVYNHNAAPMASTSVSINEEAAMPLGSIAPDGSAYVVGLPEGQAVVRVTCILGLYGRQDALYANDRPHY